jgi:hypothetical protein
MIANLRQFFVNQSVKAKKLLFSSILFCFLSAWPYYLFKNRSASKAALHPGPSATTACRYVGSAQQAVLLYVAGYEESFL